MMGKKRRIIAKGERGQGKGVVDDDENSTKSRGCEDEDGIRGLRERKRLRMRDRHIDQ